MKTQKILIILLVAFLSCERDDICSENTPTTPNLIIDFYDETDNDVIKNVTEFSVYAERLITDDADVITIPETEEAMLNVSLIFNSTTSNLSLPLLIDDEDNNNANTTVVRYYFEENTSLRFDDDPTTNSNIDIVELTYTPEDIYISRACGYKSIFNAITIELLPGSDGTTWMQNIEFTETIDASRTIENENETHVQIFH